MGWTYPHGNSPACDNCGSAFWVSYGSPCMCLDCVEEYMKMDDKEW